MSTDTATMVGTKLRSGLLLRDPAGEILLVKLHGHDEWDIPGGPVHEHESPATACGRQAAEELQLSQDVHRLLVVDWASHFHVGDEVMWIFDAGRISETEVDALRVNRSEIAEAAFWPAAIMADVVAPRLARRLDLAVAAAETGLTTYAENGVVVAGAAGVDLEDAEHALEVTGEQPAG